LLIGVQAKPCALATARDDRAYSRLISTTLAAEPTRPESSPPARGSTRLTYVPGLDGLRAAAVVAVILYHGNVSWMPGGFLGVDLFFVLSGFLITTLLLRERASTGRVDLKAFWIRRFRRLVPALLLVLLALAAYIHFVAIVDVTRHSLRWDGLATLGYLANWRFIVTKQSYFASFGPPSPFKHMWSLAVEEQWYLLWPLLFAGLYALFRGRRVPMLAVVLALAAASIIAMRVLTPLVGDPGRAYYGTDTRAHTLLFGSALALVTHQRSIRSRRGLIGVQIAGLAGLAYVAFAFVHFHDGDLFLYRKGGFALFALAGTAVILAAVHPTPTAVQGMLSPRPFRFIGRMSYGLYLWHWPVDVYLTADRLGHDGKTLFVARAAATFVFALLSYKLVEIPIRRSRTWSFKAMSISGASASCVAGILVVSSLGGTAAGFGSLPARQEVIVPRTVASTAPPLHPKPADPNAAPPIPLGRDVQVPVVGDSVGYSLLASGPRIVGMRVVGGGAYLGCGVMASDYVVDGKVLVEDLEGKDCRGWSTRWRTAGANSPDVVLITLGSWEVYDHYINGRQLTVGTAAYRRALLASLDEGLGYLSTRRKPRVALLNVPCYDERDADQSGSSLPRNDPARVRWVNGVFKEFAQRHSDQVELIDFADFLCPGGRPLAKVHGIELRPDGVHFSLQSSSIVWRWLAPQLIDLAHRPAL